MAGGSGERFWPVSRKTKPKHLLQVFSTRTLLGEALERAFALTSAEKGFVLTNEAQMEGSLEIARAWPGCRVMAEPSRRDTAAAAALATAVALRADPNSVLILLPADHIIRDTPSFCNQLRDAIALAENSTSLVTVCVKPTWPSPAFGYLAKGRDLGKGANGSRQFEISRFVEKPSLEKAAEYLATGKYSWNAGMFVWKAESFLLEADRQMPALAAFIRGYVAAEDPGAFLKGTFEHLPKTSVDYGIMEKAQKVLAVEATFDWDDVGSWNAVAKHFPADAESNTVIGQAVIQDSSNNIVVSTGRVIALCGVKDLVIVETEDALLVCHRDSVEKVRQLQAELPPKVL